MASVKTNRRSEDLFQWIQSEHQITLASGRVGHDITYELSRSQFSRFAPQAWQTAINACRWTRAFESVLILRGVDRPLIDLTVDAGRLVIRGTRELPEPPAMRNAPSNCSRWRSITAV